MGEVEMFSPTYRSTSKRLTSTWKKSLTLCRSTRGPLSVCLHTGMRTNEHPRDGDETLTQGTAPGHDRRTHHVRANGTIAGLARFGTRAVDLAKACLPVPAGPGFLDAELGSEGPAASGV